MPKLHLRPERSRPRDSKIVRNVALTCLLIMSHSKIVKLIQ